MSKTLFEQIAQQLQATHKEVNEGKMMSAPGIQYRKKNFAFLYKDKSMCFRLGREFNPQSLGIDHYELLNPFKNKPALKDWFVIGIEYTDKWPELAQIALKKLIKG